jgi:hypothetical protein
MDWNFIGTPLVSELVAIAGVLLNLLFEELVEQVVEQGTVRLTYG